MEIDFVMDDTIPLQVSYAITESTTFEREIQGLFRFLHHVGSKVGYILTWNESDTISKDGKSIEILPAWYFLLFGILE